MDVFEEDPLTDSPALGCDRIVCSPHRAGIAPETERRAIEIARDEILRALRCDPLRPIVNDHVVKQSGGLLTPEGTLEEASR